MGFTDVTTGPALLEKSVTAACLVALDCLWAARQRVLKRYPECDPLLFAPRRGAPVLPQIGVADSSNLLPVSWRAVLCDWDTCPTLLGCVADSGS